MKTSMMQNPPDPEDAFRSKAGKAHRGYAANLEECVGENGSVKYTRELPSAKASPRKTAKRGFL